MAIAYTFDTDNRLIQVTDWATGTTTYAYDSGGRLSAITLPNGVQTTHTYDAAGRLTDLLHARGTTVLAHYQYALDGVGNRTHVTEVVSAVKRVISYTYDDLRLTEADYSTGENYAYVYDAVGNREVMTNAMGIYTYPYDAANRLTSIELPVSSFQSYTWDDRGDLTNDGVFTYTYNAAGRMVRAESITTTLVYTYTADGLRVAQSVDGAATAFVWDWAAGVPEMLYDGRYTYLIGHDTLGWQTGTDWRFMLPDALGSVRQENDAA